MNHLIHIAQLSLSLVACVSYPFWVLNGYLTEPYPIIGAFIACYGSLIGGAIWYYKNFKNL